MTALTKRPEWKALKAHREKIGNTHLRDLFAADPTRGETLTAEGAGLFLDYSKNLISADSMTALFELARVGGSSPSPAAT